jgi:hypothetical protein
MERPVNYLQWFSFCAHLEAVQVAVKEAVAMVDHPDIRGSMPHNRDSSGAASDKRRGLVRRLSAYVVTPFTLTSNSQFRAVPPPSLTSRRYAAAYNEVKSLGARFNSGRTAEQTEIGLFWYSNYLVLWYQALQDIAAAHVHNIDDSARLFAVTSLAMGDAVLTAWDTKYHFASWRPITAIRNGDSDGNPETVADPNWEPLQNNPNYPEYTSGANNVTGAVTRMLALIFGTDEMTFTVTTTNHLPAIQTTRTYNHFSDAAADVVNARIYAGIHFRFADLQGRRQGRHVARWVFTHFLRSVDDDDHDDRDDEE